ncbi:hypothetical protein QBC34DRAFT_468638 [Podospora aff. communis PSN243]|uniref:F-box domain-containing protein n=1 Tax=Podospora aff. communis PSN243 TaxID=3040156 RepID=A0AAV9GIW0_9PEZI|nr:hypothetical protein QBC34DRAFT_468638 [Podospora aff. communis PSN243]
MGSNASIQRYRNLLIPHDHDSDAAAMTETLGALDKLPVELLFEVMDSMDIDSVLNLARVNKRARSVVQGYMQPFPAVLDDDGLNWLCFVQKLGVGSRATVKALDGMLRILDVQICASCGYPDSYIPGLGGACDKSDCVWYRGRPTP